MNNVIGIISYLPDEEEIRKVRLERCLNLIAQASSTFDLPIMLIAQNGTIEELKQIKYSTRVTVHIYDKLGITKAREILRRYFIQSEYDYLITMDDDLELNINDYKLNKYMKHLDGVHGVEVQNFLMNLLALPKDIAEKEPFDLNTDAEAGTGYEDWIYVINLKDKYGNRYVKFENSLTKDDRHTMTLDKFSTGKGKEKEDQTSISRKKIAENYVRARQYENLSK